MTQSCSAVKSVTIEETISLKLPENKYTIIVTAEASRSPKQSQKCESHMNDPVLPSRTLVLIAAQPTPILHLSYLQHFADTSGKCLFTFLFCWLYVVPKKRLCPQLQICHPWKLLQSAWKQHHIGCLTRHSVDGLEGSEKPSHLKNKKTSCETEIQQKQAC